MQGPAEPIGTHTVHLALERRFPVRLRRRQRRAVADDHEFGYADLRELFQVVCDHLARRLHAELEHPHGRIVPLRRRDETVKQLTHLDFVAAHDLVRDVVEGERAGDVLQAVGHDLDPPDRAFLREGAVDGEEMRGDARVAVAEHVVPDHHVVRRWPFVPLGEPRDLHAEADVLEHVSVDDRVGTLHVESAAAEIVDIIVEHRETRAVRQGEEEQVGRLLHLA